MKNLLTAALATFTLLQLPALGQMLQVDLGNISLQPNQSGQVRDLIIENTGPAAVENIFGLNFALQIGDGASGPQVDSISLSAGNSIFSSYAANQVDQGSNRRILFFGIDSGDATLTLPGSSSTLIARLTLDTTGLDAASGPWTISASGAGPLNSATEFVLSDGSSRPIDIFGGGTLAIVPEPSDLAEVAGALMAGFAIWHKARGGSALERELAANKGLD
jgi:hypothetical protein